MNNEKIMILKMLEEKKITIEEASRLLDAASSNSTTNEYSPNSSEKKTESKNTESKNTESKNSTNYQNTNNNERYSKEANYSQTFDDLANEFSKKIETFAKDFEPKFHKFAEVIVEKTANMADKLSKTVQNSYSASSTETKHTYTPPRKNIDNELNFELLVSGRDNQLNLSAVNGNILIKGYNGDKITAKVFYKHSKGNGNIELTRYGNKYMLNFNEDEFEHISIDAFVPENMFSNIIAETINGKINLSTLNCHNLVVNNTNGETIITNVNAENIKIDCNNNHLKIDNLTGRTAKIDNFNGDVNLSNFDVEKLKFDAFNSNIVVNILDYKRYNEYLWEIETSNGKILFNLPISSNLGYYVNARTTLGNVKIGLIGLNYISNSPNFIEARTINFDSLQKKVLLRLETSNAPLVIN